MEIMGVVSIVPTRPVPAISFPLSSGVVLHSRAQWPIFPQRAHLVFDLSLAMDIRLGLWKTFFLPNFVFRGGAFDDLGRWPPVPPGPFGRWYPRPNFFL